MSSEKPSRLFVAIMIPKEVQQTIMDQISNSDTKGVNWQTDIKMHITLYFLGDQTASSKSDIVQTLKQIQFPKFDIALSKFGNDGTRTLRIFFDPSSHFHSLSNQTHEKLSAHNPNFNFSGGHITLARLQGIKSAWIDEFLQKHMGAKLPTFTVDKFVLLSSHSGQYSIEETFNLI